MQAAAAAREILAMRALPNLELVGIYSHCSSAYQRYDDYTALQLGRFKALLAELAAEGMTFPFVHIAASDALNNFPESTRPPFTLCRCGINMYGYCDPEVRPSMHLVPVVELKTRLAAVRILPAGASIGYGRMHRLRQDTRRRHHRGRLCRRAAARAVEPRLRACERSALPGARPHFDGLYDDFARECAGGAAGR